MSREKNKTYILLNNIELFNDNCHCYDKKDNILTSIISNENTEIIGIFESLIDVLKHLGIEVDYCIKPDGIIMILKDGLSISADYKVADINLWDAFLDFYHNEADNCLKGLRFYRVDKSVGFMDILG